MGCTPPVLWFHIDLLNFRDRKLISGILRIHVQKKEYFLEIKMYVLERQKV